MFKIYLRRLSVLPVFVLLVNTVFCQVTVIPYGSDWKYWANTQPNQPAAAWNGSGVFNETGWTTAPGKLGFGGDGEITCIPAGCGTLCNPGACGPKFNTTYFRKTITIANVSDFTGFVINLIRDDGAVVYVNGTEVFRSNMPGGAVIYTTSATLVDGAAELIIPTTSIGTGAFVNGANVIAVEVHQANSTSSDLGFDMELIGTVTGTVLVPEASSWKYWANTLANAPAANWKDSVGFDDAAWTTGMARLGFNDPAMATCIPAGPTCTFMSSTPGCVLNAPTNCPKYITTYFRQKFTIADLSLYTGFFANLVRDDGAVIYVNGREVWRSNMNSGPVSYSTLAIGAVAAPDESTPFRSPFIPKSYFVQGENTIAVEIHQNDAVSSDLSFSLELRGTNLPSANETIYIWSGAITPTTAKVNAKLGGAGSQVRLAASTSNTLSSPIYGPIVRADNSNNRVAALSISGLSPNTKYYYGVEMDGVLDVSTEDIGSFTTPASGPFNYKFVSGSCNLSSAHPIFTRMQEKNPLFMLAVGDFHYDNPNSGTDVNVHRASYENNMLSKSAARNLFLNTQLAYMWDDHDYCGNDSDSTAAGRANARQAYQEYVPHYPLVEGSGNIPIYQSFTVGRIHYILTDLRSKRRPPSLMGPEQKAWFKSQVLYAKDNNLITCWVSSVSFGGNQADNWGGYAAERIELSNFFRDNNIVNLFIISGDAHMLAIDNGNNHDFSSVTPNVNRYPVFSTSALNQSGSYKGGAYSEAGIVIPPNGTNNSYLNPDNTQGQYGLIEVTDAGGTNVCFAWTGYRVNAAGTEQVLVTYNFCRTLTAVLPVKLTSFSVESIDNDTKARINWKVDDLKDCQEFILERSGDGNNFEKIATIPCGNFRTYSYDDKNVLPGWNYYRLKVVEKTGATFYSAIRKVHFASTPNLKIKPNPVKGSLNLYLNNIPAATALEYSIVSTDSKLIGKGRLFVNAGNNQRIIPVTNLSAGVYYLKVKMNDGELITTFVVQ